MARRERDRSGREGDRAPNTAPPRATRGPQSPGPSRGAPAKGPAQRAPHQPPRPRSIAEDPDAYRSPGFQDLDQNPYKIDYAGLPRDVEDDEAVTAEATDRAAPQAPTRGPSLPRGMLGRHQDRRGTDPNAYRSPAFQDLDKLHQRHAARRISHHGARAPQFPEGAPRDVEEAETESAAETPKAE